MFDEKNRPEKNTTVLQELQVSFNMSQNLKTCMSKMRNRYEMHLKHINHELNYNLEKFRNKATINK